VQSLFLLLPQRIKSISLAKARVLAGLQSFQVVCCHQSAHQGMAALYLQKLPSTRTNRHKVAWHHSLINTFVGEATFSEMSTTAG